MRRRHRHCYGLTGSRRVLGYAGCCQEEGLRKGQEEEAGCQGAPSRVPTAAAAATPAATAAAPARTRARGRAAHTCTRPVALSVHALWHTLGVQAKKAVPSLYALRDEDAEDKSWSTEIFLHLLGSELKPNEEAVVSCPGPSPRRFQVSAVPAGDSSCHRSPAGSVLQAKLVKGCFGEVSDEASLVRPGPGQILGFVRRSFPLLVANDLCNHLCHRACADKAIVVVGCRRRPSNLQKRCIQSSTCRPCTMLPGTRMCVLGRPLFSFSFGNFPLPFVCSLPCPLIRCFRHPRTPVAFHHRSPHGRWNVGSGGAGGGGGEGRGRRGRGR